MRYSLAFVAMAATVTAQSSSVPSYTNPFTSYLTETNSVGVVTGHPSVNTDVNTNVYTSQPSVVTSQPAVATSPAGTPTNIPTLSTVAGSVPLATGKSGSSNSTNATVSTGTLKASGASSSKGSSGASSTNSNVGGSGSTPTATASSSSSSSTSKNAAGVLEPVLGLGLAGAAFALFL